MNSRLFSIGLISLLSVSCGKPKTESKISTMQSVSTTTSQKKSFKNNLYPFSSISEKQSDALAKLGEQLFHDKRLSGDNTISCSSCHNLQHNGADTGVVSVGVQDKLGEINTPSVFNAALNFKQFWDGRVETLEEQVDGPINNPLEMGSSWDEVIEKLNKDKSIKEEFAKHFEDGITKDNISNAIAEFERTLTTPSRFDDFLNGNKYALNQEEKQGLQNFIDFGCVSCHQGANIGGNMFQKMGIVNNYFGDKKELTNADLGRYNVTKNEEDKFYFKVPSLRNVAKTAPYFHDGSAKTLNKAIEMMLHYQVGRPASEEEISQIAAFLNSLTSKRLETVEK